MNNANTCPTEKHGILRFQTLLLLQSKPVDPGWLRIHRPLRVCAQHCIPKHLQDTQSKEISQLKPED